MKTLLLAVLILAVAYYILATAGVLIAYAVGVCCVESIILMSIGGIFVVAGLIAGSPFLVGKSSQAARQKRTGTVELGSSSRAARGWPRLLKRQSPRRPRP